jgi:hypothetical protein
MTIDNSLHAHNHPTECEICDPRYDAVGGSTGVGKPFLGDNTVFLTTDRILGLFRSRILPQLP